MLEVYTVVLYFSTSNRTYAMSAGHEQNSQKVAEQRTRALQELKLTVLPEFKHIPTVGFSAHDPIPGYDHYRFYFENGDSLNIIATHATKHTQLILTTK